MSKTLEDQRRKESLSENGDKEVDESVALRKSAEKVWSYKALGESDSINLTVSRVRDFLATPTVSGRLPSDKECIHFLQVCKLRRLNPWVGDAFIIGYDQRDRQSRQVIGAKFETIVAYQALTKRAESHEQYDGLDAGVIVDRKGELIELEGAFASINDSLVGAWCKVYRKDRGRPYVTKIRRESYDKGQSIWKKDPHGMIVKCAKAAGLRESFPNDLGGMFLPDEIDRDELVDPTELPPVEGVDRINTDTGEQLDHGEVAPNVRDSFIDDVDKNLEAATSDGAVDSVQFTFRDIAESPEELTLLRLMCEKAKEAISEKPQPLMSANQILGGLANALRRENFKGEVETIRELTHEQLAANNIEDPDAGLVVDSYCDTKLQEIDEGRGEKSNKKQTA